MRSPTHRVHISLVGTPDSQVSPLSGLYETFNAFQLLSRFEPDMPSAPFAVDIVAPERRSAHGASGLPLGAQLTPDDIAGTDIVIVPLMNVSGPEWVKGRYTVLVEWIRSMHESGAMVCSACTGVLLLAETGLLANREATIHWAFAPTFRRSFPDIRLRTDEVLITAGDRDELVMTGGVMSWHDLALHLIQRHVGEAAAQAMARLLMLQWHGEGQAPYRAFTPSLDHGDGVVLRLQEWLGTQYMVANPVEEMVARSGLPRRSLERRFRNATGRSPIDYVQNIRVAEARRLLERTRTPVEHVSSLVGYENTAFFRRVFRRVTRMAPGEYRRRFQAPPPARSRASGQQEVVEATPVPIDAPRVRSARVRE